MADDVKDKAAEQGAITPLKPGASPAEQGLAKAVETLYASTEAVIREKVLGAVEGLLAALDESRKQNKRGEK